MAAMLALQVEPVTDQTAFSLCQSSCYQARRWRPAALLLPGPPPLALASRQAADSNFPTHFLKYQEGRPQISPIELRWIFSKKN